MLVHAVGAAREAPTFIHSIRRPLQLHVTKVWSHDVNVTMATEVARRASKTDFQFKRLAKPS